MGQHEYGVVGGKGGVAARLHLKAIKACGGDLATLKRAHQCILIHQSTPRRVHDHRPLGQQRKAVGVHQAHGLGRGGTVQRQEIGNTQQAFDTVMVGRAVGLVGLQFGSVIIVDVHIKATRLGGKGLADAAHSDDPETRAGDLFADHKGGRPTVPSAAAHDPVARHRAAGRTQHEQHSKLCCGIGQHIWRVRHGNAARPEGGQVAVIHANGMVGHDL
mmetsp:Transcript_23828/g.43046  ORF Transcript_23828/g.43046 Transcript_23828/m.43046 type:complete len:217 (-) Transcript_23828:462-1112(-)